MFDKDRPLIPADIGVKPGKDGKAAYRRTSKATLEVAMRDPKLDATIRPMMMNGSRKGHKVLDGNEILSVVLANVTPGQKAAILGQPPFTEWDAVSCLMSVIKKYNQVDTHWKLTGEWSKKYAKRLSRRPSSDHNTTG